MCTLTSVMMMTFKDPVWVVLGTCSGIVQSIYGGGSAGSHQPASTNGVGAHFPLRRAMPKQLISPKHLLMIVPLRTVCPQRQARYSDKQQMPWAPNLEKTRDPEGVP